VDAGGRLRWIHEHRFTRRQILIASAAGVGWCAWAGGQQAAAPLSPPSAAASASAELTPQRRKVYEALVAAVVAGPSLRLDPACASSAAAHFASVYATWSSGARQHADGVLEELEWSPHEARFSRQPRAARASFLRGCTRVTSADPSGAERRRLALAEGALGLVAVAVGPGEEAAHGLVSV
jgi:hypothetical protein